MRHSPILADHRAPRPVVRRRHASLLAVALGAAVAATLALSAPAGATRSTVEAKLVTSPAESSPEYVVVKTLELIKAGNFDGFIAKYCHKGKLCTTGQAKSSLKRYNLPSLQRLAPKCLKAGGAIDVTRVKGDPAKDVEVKVFITCDPRGMPRPFTLRNDEDGKWKHSRI